MQNQSVYIGELKFCLNLREENGGCTFGGGTRCSECAVPYMLYKFISGEVLHGNMDRLSLDNWKGLIEKYKATNLSSLK
ncbi:MAG: hypothetical protein WAZ12_01670 [Candidatus Absconditicoccaceae bacterium]